MLVVISNDIVIISIIVITILMIYRGVKFFISPNPTTGVIYRIKYCIVEKFDELAFGKEKFGEWIDPVKVIERFVFWQITHNSQQVCCTHTFKNYKISIQTRTHSQTPHTYKTM